MGGSRKGIPNSTNKYETDILPKLVDVQEWLMQGDTVREVCRKLSISPETWYKYCREHETLMELVNMGRSVLCNEVEKSLLKLCTGYEYEELKTIVEEDKNGKKRTKLEKIKRHQPPSAQAISFFLRNRMPEEWSDKKELILDTRQNEEARKQLFLEMVNGEVVDISECQDEHPRSDEE
jgi:transposase-like protein